MPSSTGSVPPITRWLGPVELVRARLVRDPIAVGIPERAGLEDDDPPAATGQPLREDRAPGAGADDREIDLVAVAVGAHRGAAGESAAVGIEQKAGIVVARAETALRESRERSPHGSPRSSDGLDRVLGARLGTLVGLALILAEPHVAARVGGAAVADLVPGPRV